MITFYRAFSESCCYIPSVMVIIVKVFFAVCLCIRVRVGGCVWLGVFVNPTMTTDGESCPLLWPLQPLSLLWRTTKRMKEWKKGSRVGIEWNRGLKRRGKKEENKRSKAGKTGRV